MVSELTSQRAFFGVSALLFAAGAAVTIVWCASMNLSNGYLLIRHTFRGKKN
jgi:hypothetical protein